MRRREFIAGLAGAATWPIAVRAQQSPVPVIGFLHPATAASYAPYVAAFRHALAEQGFVDGRNVVIEFRWGDDDLTRLPALVAQLVRLRVAVLVTGGGTAAAAAKAATSTIPIVFSTGVDPVRAGLVASFNRPGGNATGSVQFNDDLVTKRLEILRELVPDAYRIGVIVNPPAPATEMVVSRLTAAAGRLGLKIRVFKTPSQQQFEPAFVAMVRDGVRALIVQNDPLFTDRREHLVSLAARYAIPAAYEYSEFVMAGGLFSYGSSNSDAYRLVGTYVGRILKGEKPANMPVVQPTQFEFALNAKTARALGLTVPQSILLRADEVIE
jgi:putative tryptophan/tyrosine transport system substrate-binding protein